MRHVTCSHCNRTDVPVNESLHIDDVVFCHTCVNATFTEDQLKGRNVVNEFDPTVCSSCSKDFGDTTLAKVAQYPMCPACAKAIEKKSFPTWVKAFFIGILVVVVFSTIYNWRFIEGYKEMNAATRAMQAKDYKTAARNLSAAFGHVPEQQDLKHLAHYCQGVTFLEEDNSTAALSELQACVDFMPEDYEIPQLIVRARLGATFDTKNYDQYLQVAKEHLRVDSTEGYRWSVMASAYACWYATTKTDSAKIQYNICRSNALVLDNSAEMMAQINRMDHRFETGEIITAEEFAKRFPNGWIKN
ncbi:MAG TPA: hypothetical protein VIU12_13720 [Chryseolinea sp.]